MNKKKDGQTENERESLYNDFLKYVKVGGTTIS